MLSSLPGLHPPGATSNPPPTAATTKNVSRHCLMSPGSKISCLRTTVISSLILRCSDLICYFFNESFHFASGTKKKPHRPAEMSISWFFCSPMNLYFKLPDGRNTIHVMDRLGHLQDWIWPIHFRVSPWVLGHLYSVVTSVRKELGFSSTPPIQLEGRQPASTSLVSSSPPYLPSFQAWRREGERKGSLA